MTTPFVQELPYRSAADAFANLLDEPYPLFLDSSLADPRLGRYSYVMADPPVVLKSKGRRVELTLAGQRQETDADPFAVLRSLLRQRAAATVSGMPPFQGGAAGYFGYDLCHHLEVLPCAAVDDVALPDLCLGLYDVVAAYDHVERRAWLLAIGEAVGDETRLAERRRKLLRPAAEGSATATPGRRRPDFRANFSRDGYLQAIRQAKEYIAAGDIYQVNLSQRFEAVLPAQPWAIYQRLRAVSPVPFGAYFDFGDGVALSASMEQFLRVDGGQVETRPIKGTRPRGLTPQEDEALADELQASVKDRAENVMIVDLLRNDLGRVCRVGSVNVPELFVLEPYSTVYHLVSTVVGQLAEGRDSIDLLRATFPGGSVTGCPKIRAMQIIDELEPTQRGIYCGSIGYIGYDGAMNTNIVIRTMVIKGKSVYFQVGGAIVADSEPEAEYQETLDKAKASMLALEAV